jgi:hypothetical protein
MLKNLCNSQSKYKAPQEKFVVFLFFWQAAAKVIEDSGICKFQQCPFFFLLLLKKKRVHILYCLLDNSSNSIKMRSFVLYSYPISDIYIIL